MVLTAEILNDKEIKEILNAPEQYIDSKEYFSWERFFTELLIQKSDGTYLQYSKRILPQSYLNPSIKNKILQVIEKVDFKWNM